MIEIARREMIYFWYYFSIQFEQIFRYWILGMILGSVVSVFLKDYIHNVFRSMGEKKLGIVGIFAASALGIASPFCMYGTIPIAASFSKGGIKDDWFAAFMITGPATKITNLGAVKIILDIKRFLLYLAFVMVVCLVTGFVVNMTIN